jgi:hypothetical protein
MPRVGRGWRVTVRDGPRVTRQRADSLEAALDLVERAGRELAAGSGRSTVDLHVRSFTPQQQVAGRVELSGPRVHAGVDVRGDGAAEAWTGRIARRVVAQAEGETPYAALRRAVVSGSRSADP